MNATWEGDDLFGQQALHLVIEIDDVICIDRVVLLCVLKDITDDIVCILLLLHQLLRIGIVIDLKTTISGQNACHTMSDHADILVAVHCRTLDLAKHGVNRMLDPIQLTVDS